MVFPVLKSVRSPVWEATDPGAESVRVSGPVSNILECGRLIRSEVFPFALRGDFPARVKPMKCSPAIDYDNGYENSIAGSLFPPRQNDAKAMSKKGHWLPHVNPKFGERARPGCGWVRPRTRRLTRVSGANARNISARPMSSAGARNCTRAGCAPHSVSEFGVKSHR